MEYMSTEYTSFFCIRCGNPIPFKGFYPDGSIVRGRQRKIYCSQKCESRSVGLNYYHKIKNSKDYKLKRQEYFKKWYAKNRVAFIERMSKYQREKNKEETKR